MTRKLECRHCGTLNYPGNPCRCLKYLKVENIEKYRPHLTVNCGDSVHVLPVSLLENVISGKTCFTSIDDWEKLIKIIVKDFLDNSKK